MKLILNVYTQETESAPNKVFERTLSCIHKPVLTYLHNNREYRLSLYQSPSIIKYFTSFYPEVNMLISALAKNNLLELLTSSYSQSVLSIIPLKSRASIIEKCTTLIRRAYGVKATTLFTYGQIFSPTYVSTMKNLDLNRILISSYDAVAKLNCKTEPYWMNELGKKICILPSEDKIAKSISSYSQNEISLNALLKSVKQSIEASTNETLVVSINADQLCKGASYNREDDEHLYKVITTVLETAKEKGYEFLLPREIKTDRSGYLRSGWYARDAHTSSHYSFNDIFAKNENYRYLLNRAYAMSELIASYKKDRVIKKQLEESFKEINMGSLFLCDATLSCLRLEDRRAFQRKIIATEKFLYSLGKNNIDDSHDFDEDGEKEEISYSKSLSAVYTPIGGAVYELNLLDREINIFDTIPIWSKLDTNVKKLRSFSEVLIINNRQYDLSNVKFETSASNNARTDFTFTYQDKIHGFEVIKHYKLKAQILFLSVSVINHRKEKIKGTYISNVYLSLPDSYGVAFDEKKEILLGEALKDIKTVRYNDNQKDIQAVFSATKEFRVEEETINQIETGTLGSGQYYLYTSAKFIFNIEAAKGAADVFNITCRVSEIKEKN